MAEKGPYALQGYDTFDGEFYDIQPIHDTEEEVLVAAKEQWEKIQRDQPPETAGEIQDKLFIVDITGHRRSYP